MRRNEENRRQILLCIATYIGLYGFPPSLRELCRMCGYKSTAPVRRYIRQLEEENWITYNASGPETMELKKARMGLNSQRYALMECG